MELEGLEDFHCRQRQALITNPDLAEYAAVLERSFDVRERISNLLAKGNPEGIVEFGGAFMSPGFTLDLEVDGQHWHISAQPREDREEAA